MGNSGYRTTDYDNVPLELLAGAVMVKPNSAQCRTEIYPPQDRLYAALGQMRQCRATPDAAIRTMQRGVRVFDLDGDRQNPGFEMQAGIHGFDL